MVHMDYGCQGISFLIDLFIEIYVLSHLTAHRQLTFLTLNDLRTIINESSMYRITFHDPKRDGPASAKMSPSKYLFDLESNSINYLLPAKASFI